MMGSKTGRPPSEGKPLTHDLKFQLDDDSYSQLKEYSERNGKTVAVSVRQFILKALNEEK